MKSSLQKNRPKYLDLLRIKLPLTGIVSIAHRISGIFLMLSLPVWLYALDTSLRDPIGYQAIVHWFDSFIFNLFAFLCFWALAHHFFAGIRFLLADLDIGMEKSAALNMAKGVILLEALTMLFVLGWLL